jgi:hypothetical protein
VHADDREWASKGKLILEQTGAEDLSSIGESKEDFGNTDRPTARVEPVAPVEGTRAFVHRRMTAQLATVKAFNRQTARQWMRRPVKRGVTW